MYNVDKIFNLLKERKLRQIDLAQAIGVSQGNVASWKNGTAKPSVDVIQKIADYFKLPLSDFYVCDSNEPILEDKTTPSPMVTTPHGDVINNTKQEENESMDGKNYVTEERLAEILEANNAKIIEAMGKMFKEKLSDSENAQDNHLEASGGN